MDLIIVRSRWLRGDKNNSFLLRSSDKKMCCMGFLAKELGASDEEILNKQLLSHCTEHPTFWDWERGIGYQPLSDVYGTNDAPDLQDTEREAILTEKFRAFGINITFVD